MCFPSCLIEYLGGVNLFFLGPRRSPSRVGKGTAVVGWDGNVFIEKKNVRVHGATLRENTEKYIVLQLIDWHK